MSKKLTELQAGALNAWTPLQQAALYHRHQAEQAAKDQAKAAADEKKKKKEEEDKKKGKTPEKPEAVTAAKVVDDLVKWWSPALASFLELFGPTHVALPVLLGVHLIYWWIAPYYLQSLLSYPINCVVPIAGTIQSLFVKEQRGDRPMWQAYWIILACVEYVELCLFGGRGGELVMWPKFKAIACLVLYSAVDRGNKGTSKTTAAMHIIGHFLPDIPKDKEKEKEGVKGPEKDRDRRSKGRGDESRGGGSSRG